MWIKKIKPVECIKYTGDLETVRKFTGLHNFYVGPKTNLEIFNHLIPSWLTVEIGDYIVRGTLGELYPLSERVFDDCYQPVTEEYYEPKS